MFLFFFTIVVLFGLGMLIRGLATACCVGAYALVLSVLKKDKERAIQAISELMHVAAE